MGKLFLTIAVGLSVCGASFGATAPIYRSLGEIETLFNSEAAVKEWPNHTFSAIQSFQYIKTAYDALGRPGKDEISKLTYEVKDVEKCTFTAVLKGTIPVGARGNPTLELLSITDDAGNKANPKCKH